MQVMIHENPNLTIFCNTDLNWKLSFFLAYFIILFEIKLIQGRQKEESNWGFFWWKIWLFKETKVNLGVGGILKN